jgi:hypothetical protein
MYVYGVTYFGAMVFNLYSETPYLRFLDWAVDFNIKVYKILKWRKFITKVNDFSSMKLEVQQGNNCKLNIKWRFHCILMLYFTTLVQDVLDLL